MPESSKKLTKKRRRGRPPKHAGYSLIHRDELIKQHPRLRQYLEDTRAGLIRDVAGSEEELSEQQRIVIDRVISRLSVCRLIECYIEKCGIFRRDKLKRFQVLELEPALGQNYLAFSNSIDRAIIALGLSRKKASTILAPYEVIEQEEARAKKKGKEEEHERE